jgi:hypothetical protein
MSDKIYQPETVAESPLPLPGSQVIQAESTTVLTIPSTSKEQTTVFEPVAEVDRNLPETFTAVDTIGTALNTQSRQILGAFEFGALGAIQVGKYVFGTSGDVRITPSGITARNTNGTTTFNLDGTTGNASFLGTITAGSVIAGAVNVGGASVILDGANTRILITDETSTPRILIGYQAGGF